MADERTTTGAGAANAATDDPFKNFPPIPEGHTRVFLKRSWAPRGQQLKGPGWSHVPDSWLPLLAGIPDLVKTDAAGVPLASTTAASAMGSAGTTTAAPAIPVPIRDESGDFTPEFSETAPATDDFTAHRAATTEAAQSGERTGGETIGETESHLDESLRLSSQPGHTPDSSSGTSTTAKRSTRAAGAEPEGPQPATKTALREYGDLESLRALGKENNVKGADDWTNKEDAIDALYDARVTIEK